MQFLIFHIFELLYLIYVLISLRLSLFLFWNKRKHETNIYESTLDTRKIKKNGIKVKFNDKGNKVMRVTTLKI